MFYFALFFAKIADWLINFLHVGSGSTWPGEIALRIDPYFIAHSLTDSPTKIILVVGTNGKTTTSRLIVEGLKKARKSVIYNPEGANLLNGIASCILGAYSFKGKVAPDYAVFELDENAFPRALSYITKPYAIILLNLFRDQLDRYGEVHAISTHWAKAISCLPKDTQYFINGDDPRLAYIGMRSASHAFYFGAANQDKQKKEVPHDVDSIYCPRCGNRLEYTAMSYSHLGDYICTSCQFKSPEKWTEPIRPLGFFTGVYNRYNTRAAIALLYSALKISPTEARELIDQVKPAFGRQERFNALGKKWIVILSKNPSGFNQSIESLSEFLGTKKTTICLVLNDKIPDGTDVSWIWDVEFEKVFNYANTVVTSGDRAYDMAIRMQTPKNQHTTGHAVLEAELNLKKALKSCVTSHKDDSVPIIILATYTGMLEARRLLVGRALL